MFNSTHLIPSTYRLSVLKMFEMKEYTPENIYSSKQLTDMTCNSRSIKYLSIYTFSTYKYARRNIITFRCLAKRVASTRADQTSNFNSIAQDVVCHYLLTNAFRVCMHHGYFIENQRVVLMLSKYI